MRTKHANKATYLAPLIATGLLLAGCGADPQVSGEQASSEGQAVQSVTGAGAVHYKELCERPTQPGQAHCHLLARTDEQGNMTAFAAPSGLVPADLVSAYQIPNLGGQGQVVAIVDAYDDPSAEADLAVYRSQFGLPACTTANGCFKKINQNGASSPLPASNTGWAGEISLDLDMVSAACPNCAILLVEANSNSSGDLYTAELAAINHGATVVSNSWGGAEYSGETSDEAHYFNHPGVAIFASSGDGGYGVEFPSASQYVTAVGGTSLTRASNARGWSESAWGGSGSGCSHYVSKPSWQKDAGCKTRTVADVSAIADPSTGVAIYDTFGFSGWGVAGGTSVASPLVAAIYAVTGNSSATGSFSYQDPAAFFDVTTGSDGSCAPSYLCTAGSGYDGPTGNGTPSGASMLGYGVAFQANTGSLWLDGEPGRFDAMLGMMSGTSPSVAALSHGGYEVAFQANTGTLWMDGTEGRFDTTLGMMSGTSPSITATSVGAYQVAFQGSNGDLWLLAPLGSSDQHLGMMPGTSPSITAMPDGGYVVAFQANTGTLWMTGEVGTFNTGLAMMSGTSPSVVPTPTGGYQVAFQASSSDLWLYGTAYYGDLHLGMMAHTSPSIAMVNGTWAVAFQANTGALFLTGPAPLGNVNTGLAMMSGTSPSLAALPGGGYEVAFQASSSSMWLYGTAGRFNTMLGMMPGTSPSIW